MPQAYVQIRMLGELWISGEADAVHPEGERGENESLGDSQEERSAIKCNARENPKTCLCFPVSGLTAMLVAVFMASSYRERAL